MGLRVSWSVLAASSSGTSHSATGTPCQDAFRHTIVGDRLLIALADGAGSAAFAETGAAVACQAVIDCLTHRVIDADMMLEAIDHAHEEVGRVAEALGRTPRDLACTLLVGVIGPDSATFAQVGDGFIIFGRGGIFEPVFWPREAAYANTTDFVTDANFSDLAQFHLVAEPLDEIAFLSDGLQRLAIDFVSRAGHAGFFGPMFARLDRAADPTELAGPFAAFLDSARVNERTDDDKTLILALRRMPHADAD